MLKSHILRTIIFTLIGIGVAVLGLLFSRPIYEGRLEMLVNDASRTGMSASNIFTPEVAEILNRAQQQGATTERQLLSSQSIFFQALAKVDEDRGGRPNLVTQFEELYPLYDVETARNTNATLDAGVLLIRARAYSAKDAAAIATNISLAYQAARERSAQESVDDALNYLKSNGEATKKNLDVATAAVEKYKADNKITDLIKDLNDQTTIYTTLKQKSQAIQSEIDGTDAEIRSGESQLNRTAKLEEGSSNEMRSPLIGQYEAELASLQGRRAIALGQYLEDADVVKQIDEAIKNAKQRLAEAKKTEKDFGGSSRVPSALYQRLSADLASARNRRENLQAQLAKVNSQMAEQETLIGAIPKKEAGLTERLRELRIYEDQYSRVKVMREDLENRSKTAARPALVLNTVQEDATPVAPVRTKFLLAGAVAGMCLGLLVSFLIESLKLRIHSSTQLTALTGLPVVASLPSKQRTGRKALLAMARPSAVPPEAFRYMAFSMVTNNSKTMRTFMFTGIRTAMTTYSSALQFATAIAKSGTRVLLVDADMLKSPITRVLDAGGKPGLSDLLTAETASNVQDYIVETVHQNLLLMPGGTDVTAKFLTNIAQPKLEAVLQALRLSADVIVFAVPPCDVLADASTLARHVDDVCLVVSATQTNYRAVPLAQDLLNKAGAKNVSIVMTHAAADEEPFAKSSAYLARSS